MNKHIKLISEILIETILQISADQVTVSFSGGIDSSLLAFLIKKYNTNVKAIQLVYAGLADTADDKFSTIASKLLDLPLDKYILDNLQILNYCKDIGHLINTKDLIEISYLLPFYAVCEKAKYKTIVIGQGADELFMGYSKFKKDLVNANELSVKIYNDLLTVVKDREYKIAEHFDKKLIMPYLNNELSKLVLPLDVKYKNNGKNVKIVLREVAKYLGLPQEIAERPKKAAQYGSGVWKVIKNLERR